jgi:hypothetical protein
MANQLTVDLFLIFTIANGAIAMLNLIRPLINVITNLKLLEQRVLHNERMISKIESEMEDLTSG